MLIRRLALLLILTPLVAVPWLTRAQSPQPEIDEPLAAIEAARTAIVPEGFKVTLFAGEPEVLQPVATAIDDRGRLWVAEAYSYPRHTKTRNDRIVIFEDVDGDGRHDRRTVFYDQLNYVTGIEIGFGGVWVVSSPYFYFIPDRDRDDRPDAAPQVLLDGLGTHANAHNLANNLAWGPDGWLYGTHGRTNWSMIGKPGTPDDQRQRFDGGVYRYHPTRHIWEPYADGTTNPWGIDWNDVGDAFITNCVNPHLFHVIYGAHYEPWRNRESSQYAYERIPTIADHLHFVGEGDIRNGLGSAAEDEAGGGHAHCGTMIYLGDNWPTRYRDSLFTNNIHGRRINNDRLERHGSGYVAKHAPDLLRSRDPWFMGTTLCYGPDGGVFVTDWSDTGECHSTKNTRRQTGRVFKVTYGQPKAQPVDLAKLSGSELVALQLHANDWHVRHARRVLQERHAAGQPLDSEKQQLREMLASAETVPKKLRALWALYVLDGLDEQSLPKLLEHDSEYVRAWGVRLLCESRRLGAAVLRRCVELAEKDGSPYVRLHLASCLQRLPLADRGIIASKLMQHAEDADDDNLPLLVWYAIEPLVNEDQARFIEFAAATRWPLIARHVARRVSSIPTAKEGLNSLVAIAAKSPDDEIRSDLLAGLLTGLAGRRSVPMPTAWPTSYASLKSSPNEAVREQALELALVFDDPVAIDTLRQVASDPQQAAKSRVRAIQALVSKQTPAFDAALLKLLDDPVTRRAALRGLAEYEHPSTAAVLLQRYSMLDPAERQDALQTLAARVAWAGQLIEALEKGTIPRSDLTAFTARQIESLGNAPLTARLKAVWGEVRNTPAEKAKLIAGYKQRLTPDSLARADRSAGRAVFQKLCANCHTLFDAGGKIGPNITGSQRTNLDYLLHTIVDPNAAIAKDYQMHIIETTSGRVLTGLIAGETKAAVTMQTVNEQVVVPVGEIEQRMVSPLSMMPEGALQPLTTDQVRALIAYLMGPGQVPLPENATPAGS